MGTVLIDTHYLCQIEPSPLTQSKKGADMQKNTLWSGGRLEAALNQSMADLNRSLDIDKRMAEQDIRGSQA